MPRQRGGGRAPPARASAASAGERRQRGRAPRACLFHHGKQRRCLAQWKEQLVRRRPCRRPWPAQWRRSVDRVAQSRQPSPGPQAGARTASQRCWWQRRCLAQSSPRKRANFVSAASARARRGVWTRPAQVPSKLAPRALRARAGAADFSSHPTSAFKRCGVTPCGIDPIQCSSAQVWRREAGSHRHSLVRCAASSAWPLLLSLFVMALPRP